MPATAPNCTNKIPTIGSPTEYKSRQGLISPPRRPNNRLAVRFAQHGLQDRFFRLLIKVHALPHLDHQQGPNLQGIVAAVLFMVAQELLHRIRAEDAPALNGRRRKELL